MKPDDLLRLRHIADALNAAVGFVQGRGREDLAKDTMLLFAVVHALQIAGEAASRVSAETRDRHRQIPWASIIGMRHRLVHAYVDINQDIVWTTVTRAAPDLLSSIRELLDTDE